MRFSAAARGLAESATMRVSRKAAELRAAGRRIVDLSAGQPDFPSPTSVVDAARRALEDGHTRYTAAAGLPDLRRALADRYARVHGAPWSADETMVTVGAKAALFELVQVLVGPGDGAVLPSPAWVSFEEQIRFAGGRPTTVAMAPADRFAIRARPLIAACDETTRLVLVNSPCNPTGGVLAADELEELAAFCADRGLVLLCDETYERFVYDGGRHASAAALAGRWPRTVVVVGSFSKTYSMTGWRLGYALGPRPLIAKAIELQSHLTSNPTSFAMYGGLAALTDAEDDVARMLAEFEERRRLVVDALGRLPGVTCEPPAGAFYAFPDVRRCFGPGRQNSVELAEHLLEHAGVAVVPGAAFGDDGHIRLSFACSRRDLELGLRRMADALDS